MKVPFNILLPANLITLALMPGKADSIQANTVKKPNVIIVITDDQGKGDLGCYGNKVIKTPNIDRFYADAVRLDNFHVSTTSAPSRSSLMTGRHCNRVNCFHTIGGRSLLFENETIMPQVFAENGYVTGMFGKWHLGDNYPFRPEDRGFHEVVRHSGGGIGQTPDYWGNDYFDDTFMYHERKSGRTIAQKYKGYCTDVFFSEAIKFIRENKESPFFCYIATNAPHNPLNVPKKYLDIYKGEKQIVENQKRFYGMITNIDDNFKILTDELDKLGLTENTILIFMTDNGTADGRPVIVEGKTYGNSGGLRGAKGSQYEGGHRVPFMIRWPAGNIYGGKDITNLTAHYDILPTLVDLAGLKFSPVNKPDGISLVPILSGTAKNWPDRVLYMDTQRLQNLVKGRLYAVMNEKWRLVDGKELYDINSDLAQSTNVIEQYPEVAKYLALAYDKWWESLDAPSRNSQYAYIKVGSPYENPTCITSHDLLTGQPGNTWHQNGVASATQAIGLWKIEVLTAGNYAISLRRFPRESGLGFNESFPGVPDSIETENEMPASINPIFTEAYLYIADFEKRAIIKENDREITFKMFLPSGKYDVEARLFDTNGKCYPAYYFYIEKFPEPVSATR